MRARLASLIVLALVASLPCRLAEPQIISGVVVEETSGFGVSRALILLIGEDDRSHVRALSDESGHFLMRAPLAGNYTLRALRIGFRSTELRISNLAAGETRKLRVAASVTPVKLAEIRVDERAKCVIGPREGMDTYRVWDEARKVLAVTALSQEERRFRVTLSKYRRVLDPQNERIRQEQRTQQSGLSERPFVSRPAAELATLGYARHDSTGITYFAPDANVLLSDEFLHNHCFRLQRGTGAELGLLGLAFAPAVERGHVDIAGALWLDAETSELRFVEYSYTGVPRTPAWRKLGGRVEFQRLPNNSWIVQRWAIRLPEIRIVTSRSAVVPGLISEERRTDVLVSLQEEGGEVLKASAADGSPLSSAERASLVGLVFDSARGVPLQGARVFLSGTSYAAVTDSTGRFRMSGLPSGEFSVSFQHARLDSIGAVGSGTTAQLAHGTETTANLYAPSLSTLISLACADSSIAGGAGMVTGIVRDAKSGDPLKNGRVVIVWSDSSVRQRSSRVRGVEARTDPSGRYRACGVPAGVSLVGRALKEERSGPPSEIRLAAKEIAYHDFLIARDAPDREGGAMAKEVSVVTVDSSANEPGASPTTKIRAIVRDLNGNPIAHATVRLATRERWVPVGSGGSFRFDSVSPGRDTLDVRALGYAPERVTLDLGKRPEYVITVALPVASRLLADTRIEAPRSRSFFAMSGFESRRKRGLGHFITRAQIEASGATRVSDALRSVPGISIASSGGTTGAAAAVRMQRGGGECTVAYFLNGDPLELLQNAIDQEINLSEVEAIEVYRGGQTPPGIASTAFVCGVVMIWTRPPASRQSSSKKP